MLTESGETTGAFRSGVVPVTDTKVPVVNDEASEHSHTAASAISSGVPNRANRLSRAATSRASRPRRSMASRSMAVSIAPGQMALTRMPDGA